MFENMTFEQWTQATQPKVTGSWNLHKFMPEDLDFFIMLSSMAGVIGNPGQANYSAAGTFQDALSEHRRANGLVAMTVDLGIVSDVGYIAENPEHLKDWIIWRICSYQSETSTRSFQLQCWVTHQTASQSRHNSSLVWEKSSFMKVVLA